MDSPLGNLFSNDGLLKSDVQSSCTSAAFKSNHFAINGFDHLRFTISISRGSRPTTRWHIENYGSIASIRYFDLDGTCSNAAHTKTWYGEVFIKSLWQLHEFNILETWTCGWSWLNSSANKNRPGTSRRHILIIVAWCPQWFHGRIDGTSLNAIGSYPLFTQTHPHFRSGHEH